MLKSIFTPLANVIGIILVLILLAGAIMGWFIFPLIFAYTTDMGIGCFIWGEVVYLLWLGIAKTFHNWVHSDD